jgi:hypothetical protein
MGTTTSSLITMLLIMMTINISLTLFQSAIIEAGGSATIINSSSPYNNYIQGNSLVVDESYLPADSESEADNSGNIFTDTYDTFKSWVKKTMEPLGFLSSMLTQPYGFLKDIGLPIDICLAIAVLWYLIALVLIVAFIGGR